MVIVQIIVVASKWMQHVIILWKIVLRNWSILFIIVNWEFIHTSPYAPCRLNHLKEIRCGKLLPELPFIVWHSLTSRAILTTALGYHCHMFDSLSLSVSVSVSMIDVMWYLQNYKYTNSKSSNTFLWALDLKVLTSCCIVFLLLLVLIFWLINLRPVFYCLEKIVCMLFFFCFVFIIINMWY